jgi:hypothetical protein
LGSTHQIPARLYIRAGDRSAVVSQGSVKSSGLSKWAIILMFVLGLLCCILVKGRAGRAIMAVSAAMFLFNRWLIRKLQRSMKEETRATPS